MSFFDFVGDRLNTFSVRPTFLQCVDKLDKECVEQYLPNVSNELLKESEELIHRRITDELTKHEIMQSLLRKESDKRKI